MSSSLIAAPDTVNIYFKKGVSELSTEAFNTLDSLVYFESIFNGKKAGVYTYADYEGKEASNEKLARQRAYNIAMYLKEMGGSDEDIIWILTGEEQDAEDIKRYIDGTAEIIPEIVIKQMPEVPGQAITLAKKEKKQVIKEDEISAPKPIEREHKKLVLPPIDIASVKINETIRLEDISFKGGKDILMPGSIPPLTQLSDILKKNPKLKICIEGHICCILKPDVYAAQFMKSTEELSLKRAKAVYDFLVEKGISAARLKYMGFGFNNPLASPENNEDDRRKNRRVEIRVLSK